MIETRDLVFDRLSVDFLQRGGARVSWRFFRQFTDPGPYTCQLQFSSTNTPTADDWIDCGPPVANGSYAIDPVRRAFGKHQRCSYRISMTTSLGSYTSQPVPVTGVVGTHDWLLAREMIRQHRLRLNIAAGVAGYLFKRRWVGQVPDPRQLLSAATSAISGSQTRTTQPQTAGTPYVGGYFEPIAFMVEVTPTSHREMVDSSLGPVDPAGISIEGFLVMVPEVATDDVFVMSGSDRRYRVQPVRNVAEWRGIPLLARCELRLIPPSDPAYNLDIPPGYADAFMILAPLGDGGGLPHARAYRS